jgi:3'(2'), 5'-bisphosphate nucleotidase
MIDFNSLIGEAKKAALAAGKAILEVYNSADFGAELKSDNSPLTLADKAAHDVIVAGLRDTCFPILSEEGRSIDYTERKNWEYFWMIDPLDGTKEFIKKNGEFTVNIALIKDTEAIAGVVYAPVLDWLYWSIPNKGAYKQVGSHGAKQIKASPFDAGKQGIRVVASRSHLNEVTQEYIDTFTEPELVSMGSSLKILLVGEGSADVYPRYAPTMEWDTAAAHAVIKLAGANVYQKDSEEEVRYNKQDLLNPYFLVRA